MRQPVVRSAPKPDGGLGRQWAMSGRPAATRLNDTFDVLPIRPGKHTVHYFLIFGPIENDFVTSRAHSMKRSTTGLRVRFFTVTIATGHGRKGKSVCNS